MGSQWHRRLGRRARCACPWDPGAEGPEQTTPSSHGHPCRSLTPGSGRSQNLVRNPPRVTPVRGGRHRTRSRLRSQADGPSCFGVLPRHLPEAPRPSRLDVSAGTLPGTPRHGQLSPPGGGTDHGDTSGTGTSWRPDPVQQVCLEGPSGAWAGQASCPCGRACCRKAENSVCGIYTRLAPGGVDSAVVSVPELIGSASAPESRGRSRPTFSWSEAFAARDRPW